MKNHLKWSSIGSGLNHLIAITAFIILAQKIPPAAFGVFAIISILFGFVKIFLEAGFRDAIIFQKIDRKSPVIASIFIFLLAVSFIFTLIFNLLKTQAALFFDIDFGPYLLWVSLLFPLLPLRVINQSLLESKMQFRAIAMVEISAKIIACISAILLAYKGHGILALVMMLILNEFLQVVLYWLVSSWKITIHFSWNELRSIYDYSKHLVVFKLVNFVVENIDKILVGKFLGKADVGIFHRSQQVTTIPSIFVSTSIVRVFFPFISSIKHDLHQVRSIHINTITAILLFFMPIMSILIVFSDELVLLILNEHWRPMIPLLQVFAVMGVFQVVGISSVNIYQSLGHTKLQSRVNFLVKGVLLVSILMGVQLGIYGLAFALLAARVINFCIIQYNVCAIIEYGFTKILSRIAPLVFVSAVYILLHAGLKNSLYTIENILALVAIILGYLAGFYILLWLVFRNKIIEIKCILSAEK
jgi:O-antigen/teichoic acid export membrane protein